MLDDLRLGSAGAQLIGTGKRTYPDPRWEGACANGSNNYAHDWPDIPYLTASGGRQLGMSVLRPGKRKGGEGNPRQAGSASFFS